MNQSLIWMGLAACTQAPPNNPIDTDIEHDPTVLTVRSLGVAGLTMRRGEDLVLTAPMVSNPELLAVMLDPIASDPALIGRFLPAAWVADATAILTGHGHYDHLLDVPAVQAMTNNAVVYGNVSVANMLAAYDVPAVLTLNDPDDPAVDRRMCPDPDPCTGVPSGNEGRWVPIEAANARIRALCSTHPPQFLSAVHFGEGCAEERLDTPPVLANDFKEGATLAFLVDFLDEDGEVQFRLYYQDAPATAPVGSVHRDLLVEHRVDLAVLNVGNFDAVEEHPAGLIADLNPRFVLGMHWENFFLTQDDPLEPIPFHSHPTLFDAMALEAMAAEDVGEALVNGEAQTDRYWRPDPDTLFQFPMP